MTEDVRREEAVPHVKHEEAYHRHSATLILLIGHSGGQLICSHIYMKDKKEARAGRVIKQLSRSLTVIQIQTQPICSEETILFNPLSVLIYHLILT